MIVRNLNIREIFATNAQKTIEVELETKKGVVRSSVPMGTSKGTHEIVYKPVDEVVRKFLMIRRNFQTEFENQEDVDTLIRIIDKTPNFSEIGGNLALGISSAFLKAFALEEGLEVFEFLMKEKTDFPKPICNVVGGWRGSGASDIQEYLLVPVHQTNFLNSMTKITNAFQEIGKALKEKDPNFVFGKNLESAWVTSLPMEEILKLIKNIAAKNLLKLGLDVAASHLWDGTKYVYQNSGAKFGKAQQVSFIRDLAERFDILYLEDPFDEDDFLSFSVLTHEAQKRIICGDDLFVTNIERLRQGLQQHATNAVLVKPNQVGTITDVIKLVKEARKNGLYTVMSHRSGETEDTMICHLAAGLNCDYIKLGISGERTVKINEMIRIEEKLRA